MIAQGFFPTYVFGPGLGRGSSCTWGGRRPGQSVTVHTGKGTDRPASGTGARAGTWNNDGDNASLARYRWDRWGDDNLNRDRYLARGRRATGKCLTPRLGYA
jgi:hypothetical protein